jgi:hypothetical protein
VFPAGARRHAQVVRAMRMRRRAGGKPTPKKAPAQQESSSSPSPSAAAAEAAPACQEIDDFNLMVQQSTNKTVRTRS